MCVPTAAWPSDMVSNVEKRCKGHPASTPVPGSLARPAEQVGPAADPAWCGQLPALPCPPRPHSNAQGLSLPAIKLYTHHWLNIGTPIVPTAQEGCLVNPERQTSAEEFELWSCFTHIMLLSPTFTSLCSLECLWLIHCLPTGWQLSNNKEKKP